MPVILLILLVLCFPASAQTIIENGSIRQMSADELSEYREVQEKIKAERQGAEETINVSETLIRAIDAVAKGETLPESFETLKRELAGEQ